MSELKAQLGTVIPLELRQYPQWVVWRKELRDGKQTKVPYRADGRGMASTTDAKSWTSYQAAADAYVAGGYDGIGFVFTANDPFTGIDLDHCLDPQTNAMESWAQVIVDRFQSYTEITPSRMGLHIILKATLPPGGNRKGKIEMYSTNRYFTITGDRLAGTSTKIEERQQRLNEIHAEIFSTPITTPNKPSNSGHLNGLTDSELINKAMAAANGVHFQSLWNGDTSGYGEDDSAADLALCNHLAFWTDNDPRRIDTIFRHSGLFRVKWERLDYRSRTIERAIENTRETYTQAKGKVLAEPEAEVPSFQVATLNEVLACGRKWLYLPNTGALEVTLGAVAANHLPGDPVWLLLVTPPGWGKTEIINSLVRTPYIHPVGVLTEASLLSGTPRKESIGAKGGLLREMGEFGIMLVKYFGGILSLSREARGPILAAMREIFDGAWTRQVGSDGGRTLTWAGKAGLVGGATPAIDGHYAVMALLGERFSYFRIPESEESKKAEAALAHAGQETQMRLELSELVAGLFTHLQIPATLPSLSDAERHKLVALSVFTTRCRSAVERDSFQSREIQLIPGVESPTRLVKVLAQLLRGLLVIGLSRGRAWELVQKTALDSMPALRQRVIAVMLETENGTEIETSKLSTSLGYPSNTVRRVLEDLACYGVCHRATQGAGKSDLWTLSDWTRQMYKAATESLPEILKSTHQTGTPLFVKI